jgi:hypothetical protein
MSSQSDLWRITHAVAWLFFWIGILLVFLAVRYGPSDTDASWESMPRRKLATIILLIGGAVSIASAIVAYIAGKLVRKD